MPLQASSTGLDHMANALALVTAFRQRARTGEDVLARDMAGLLRTSDAVMLVTALTALAARFLDELAAHGVDTAACLFTHGLAIANLRDEAG